MGAGAGTFGAAGAGIWIVGVGVGPGIGDGAVTGADVANAGALDTAGDTTLAALIGRTLPKILVTLSGTAVTRCPALRESIEGSMDASTNGSGSVTIDLSCVALSAKVPGAAALRNSPKVTFTAPEASCVKAVFTGKANEPPPGESTSAAKLDGSPGKIEARGNWITPSAPPSTVGAGAAIGMVAGAGTAAGGGGAAATGATGAGAGAGAAGAAGFTG
jgi:hypothetical protein